jgi:hypothetical protein
MVTKGMKEAAAGALKKKICHTAAFGWVGGCVVYVGSARPVTADDWDGYLEFISPFLSKQRALPRVVWDDSGGPSPVGRQKLAALTQGIPVKVALVTDVAAGRNTATVLNWNRREESYRAFASRDLRQAIEFVGLWGPAVNAVAEALHDLRREFGL